MRIKNHDPALTSLLLRIGLAVVFLYAAVNSLRHPAVWIGYLPSFLGKLSNATFILKVFAVYEIGLSLWLLSGKYVRAAALLAAASFIGIVLAQPNDLLITFRDIGLCFMALGLAAL